MEKKDNKLKDRSLLRMYDWQWKTVKQAAKAEGLPFGIWARNTLVKAAKKKV